MKQSINSEPNANARLLLSRFEAICVGIVVHGVDGAIVYANEAACAILRLDRQSYLPAVSPVPQWRLASANGTALPGDCYPPIDVIRCGEPVRNVIAGVRSSAEGLTNWYSINAEPQFDGQTAELKEVIVTLVDITALKQVEEALRVSEEKFAAAFNSTPDAININRLSDGLYLDVNTAFIRHLGYTREELIGRGSLELNIWRNPEDRATLVRGLREHGEYLGLEAEFCKKNGEVLVGIMSARITNVEGEPCIISVTRDITEQKRADEARRQYEAQAEAQKRQFYRDTISSVTAGKLTICDDVEVQPYLSSAEVVFDVGRAEDIHLTRHRVEAYFVDQGLSGTRLGDLMLAVGECITNAIKHGVRGRVYVGRTEDSVWAGIEDQGRGIESLILPQAVLRQGFSTKPSLGLGYSIMLDVADRLMLKTGDSGTTVVLIKSISEVAAGIDLDSIPDTWG